MGQTLLDPVAIEADFVEKRRARTAQVMDGERLLYVFERAPTAHEALHVLGSYEVPLAQRDDGSVARIELRFARDQEGDGLADLRVVLPWERVRRSLTAALERLSWGALQSPMPARPVADRAVVRVPTIDLMMGSRAPSKGS